MGADISDEPLDRLLSPLSYPLLQGVKLPQAVAAGVPGLELNKKLKGSLVRIFFQTLHHFLPVVFEDIGTRSPRFVPTAPVGFGTNDNTARSRVLAPTIYASEQRSVLFDGKSPWELNAELFKELHCVDVGKCFEASEHYRPDYP
jgi:hypothetical protein